MSLDYRILIAFGMITLGIELLGFRM